MTEAVCENLFIFAASSSTNKLAALCHEVTGEGLHPRFRPQAAFTGLDVCVQVGKVLREGTSSIAMVKGVLCLGCYLYSKCGQLAYIYSHFPHRSSVFSDPQHYNTEAITLKAGGLP